MMQKHDFPAVDLDQLRARLAELGEAGTDGQCQVNYATALVTAMRSQIEDVFNSLSGGRTLRIDPEVAAWVRGELDQLDVLLLLQRDVLERALPSLEKAELAGRLLK